ncbi:hypothetical protein [Aurantimonas sp. Leaf443]|uniref:hypothetical protein n=1 Tax=Aurantimonas sp. Leaf443 TaxID=1736378 RepID=UPI0006FEDEB0|nr:hypothetical protein [Aurantimonas sp. Leaf443]KQT84052.1 hypothetical protein ASG48_11805 [Aurantimonas sp. Leaf443]
MGNRADRRATAKIARQAMKRAKTPTEGAILRAAAAFAGDGLVGELGPHVSAPDFDETWERLSDDLRDILDADFPDFMVQAYVEAGGGLSEEGATVTRLVLLPVSGPRARVLAFAGDGAEMARLASSLRESGVVPEAGACLVQPGLVLPLAAFAPQATTPGRVRALHDGLVARLSGGEAGKARPPFEPGLEEGPGEEIVFGALAALERVPLGALPGPPTSEEALEAEDMARAAALESWHDSYAAELDGLSLGAPVDWPACAAALAFETLRVAIETARPGTARPDAAPDTLHCGPTSDGASLLACAVFGSVAVGPFAVPAELVWFDADAFFDAAEAYAGALAEHEDDRPVLAALLSRP